MITNKLLTLGLTLSLMGPLATYAGMGAESGGGGDAVIVNDKLVIRDLLPGQMQSVTNNLKFINSVKGFRQLVYTIAKANPELASNLILDLDRVTFYTTQETLKLLPYDQTTINGRAAEVQLAIRIDNDILFGPEFMDYEDAEYVLLHEALHGLLADNSGPLHHVRVRTIVKYIHDNINNLDSDELRNVLITNNFSSKLNLGEEEMNSYFWSEKKSEALRCTFAFRMSRTVLADYENLKCLGFASSFPSGLQDDLNLEKFMDERFPELKALRGDGKNIYLYREINSDKYRYFYRDYFTLEKDSIFKAEIKKEQKYNCSKNKDNIIEAEKLLKELNQTLVLTGKVHEVIQDDAVSNSEKVALVDAMRVFSGRPHYNGDFTIETFKVIKQWEDIVLEHSGNIQSHLEKLNEQEIACKKQYPRL